MIKSVNIVRVTKVMNVYPGTDDCVPYPRVPGTLFSSTSIHYKMSMMIHYEVNLTYNYIYIYIKLKP